MYISLSLSLSFRLRLSLSLLLPLPLWQSVDYKGMKVSPLFERYSALAVQLQRVELLSLSREEKLAFFINTYNALVIHGYLRLGPPTNVWQRYRVQNRPGAFIGPLCFVCPARFSPYAVDFSPPY